MPQIHFTQALKRFFPKLDSVDSNANNLPELITELNNQYPGLRGYLLDDHGTLRKHVNIFVDGEMIHDRENLSDQIGEKTEVYIMQALSGG